MTPLPAILGGGQHFQSFQNHVQVIHGRNEAWGAIPPPDWRAREETEVIFGFLTSCHSCPASCTSACVARIHFVPRHFPRPLRAASYLHMKTKTAYSPLLYPVSWGGATGTVERAAPSRLLCPLTSASPRWFALSFAASALEPGRYIYDVNGGLSPPRSRRERWPHRRPTAIAT